MYQFMAHLKWDTEGICLKENSIEIFESCLIYGPNSQFLPYMGIVQRIHFLCLNLHENHLYVNVNGSLEG